MMSMKATEGYHTGQKAFGRAMERIKGVIKLELSYY